jgi:hypothetical protein
MTHTEHIGIPANNLQKSKIIIKKAKSFQHRYRDQIKTSDSTLMIIPYSWYVPCNQLHKIFATLSGGYKLEVRQICTRKWGALLSRHDLKIRTIHSLQIQLLLIILHKYYTSAKVPREFYFFSGILIFQFFIIIDRQFWVNKNSVHRNHRKFIILIYLIFTNWRHQRSLHVNPRD